MGELFPYSPEGVEPPLQSDSSIPAVPGSEYFWPALGDINVAMPIDTALLPAEPVIGQPYPVSDPTHPIGNLEALFHTNSDVIPMPANPAAKLDSHFDTTAAVERFDNNYPAIAEQAAYMVGHMALAPLLEHADTTRALYEVYKVIIPI